MTKFTPNNITSLEPNQIFVFGSNLAGRHGKGAAKIALQRFNASYGQPEGLQGQSYAIPTKDKRLTTLPLEKISSHVQTFLSFAASHPHLEFLVTPIGCGLAGYQEQDIAPLFFPGGLVPTLNVILPASFWQQFQP
jgi:hypothetical protein